MNAAKVMPVDLAMHKCLNRHPPLAQLLGMSTYKSHRALTRSNTCDSMRSKATRSPQLLSSPVSALSYTNPCGILKKKKRVVFADAKGLALTAVRIFNSDPPISDVEQLSPARMQSETSAQNRMICLRLGFPQPCGNLPSFLESLEKFQVRLESCSLVSGSLFGKVRVCNISPEKAVHIRITYDSWRSHQDIPCTPVQQSENLETELFVFNIPLLSCLNVKDRLEFCVTFRPGSSNMLMWDSNDGRNYRILVEDLNSEVHLFEKKTSMPQSPQLPWHINVPALQRSRSLS